MNPGKSTDWKRRGIITDVMRSASQFFLLFLQCIAMGTDRGRFDWGEKRIENRISEERWVQHCKEVFPIHQYWNDQTVFIDCSWRLLSCRSIRWTTETTTRSFHSTFTIWKEKKSEGREDEEYSTRWTQWQSGWTLHVSSRWILRWIITSTGIRFTWRKLWVRRGDGHTAGYWNADLLRAWSLSHDTSWWRGTDYTPSMGELEQFLGFRLPAWVFASAISQWTSTCIEKKRGMRTREGRTRSGTWTRNCTDYCISHSTNTSPWCLRSWEYFFLFLWEDQEELTSKSVHTPTMSVRALNRSELTWNELITIMNK